MGPTHCHRRHRSSSETPGPGSQELVPCVHPPTRLFCVHWRIAGDRELRGPHSGPLSSGHLPGRGRPGELLPWRASRRRWEGATLNSRPGEWLGLWCGRWALAAGEDGSDDTFCIFSVPCVTAPAAGSAQSPPRAAPRPAGRQSQGQQPARSWQLPSPALPAGLPPDLGRSGCPREWASPALPGASSQVARLRVSPSPCTP